METFDPNMEEMKKAMRQKAGKAGRLGLNHRVRDGYGCIP